MKKWGWKKVSAMGLVFALAFSTTAFAGEMNVEESTEKTEQEESNGLETLLFAVEKGISGRTAVSDGEGWQENENQTVKEITLEELKKIKNEPVSSETEKKEMPQTAVVVFQPENYWVQSEAPETEAVVEESQSVEMVLDAAQESESAVSEETERTLADEELPVITLTKEQEAQVTETASLVPETIVVINGGTLKDERIFKSQKNVKAVFSMNETTEEAFEEAVKNLDMEKVYADYQKKIEEEDSSENTKMPHKLIMQAETSSFQAESVLPGNSLSKASSTPNTESTESDSTSGTEGSTVNPGTTKNGTSTNSGTGSTNSPSTGTAKKEITITMVPDELDEGDDYLYAIYEISCPDVQISEASFKLTYDSTKMSYDAEYSEDGGVDVSDDFTYTGTDNTGSVTINLKSKDGAAHAMNGDMLDLAFELKNEAKVGDVFNLKLEVTSLKNGTAELKTDANYNITVKEESIKAMAYTEEDDETQPQSQTQTQTQTEPMTQTQAQTTELQKAAKTDDTTNVMLWILLMTASMGVYGLSRRKSSQKN